jgi:hypothetical protein
MHPERDAAPGLCVKLQAKAGQDHVAKDRMKMGKTNSRPGMAGMEDVLAEDCDLFI